MKIRQKLALTLVMMLAAAFFLVSAAPAVEWEIIKDPNHVLYGNLSQNALAEPLKSAGCAPVAVMNSFTYLQNQYPGVYDNSLTPNGPANDVWTLAGPLYMNTIFNNGTYARDIIWGKYLYVEAQAPNKTIYTGVTVPLGNWVPGTADDGGWGYNGRTQPNWVTEMNSGPSMRYLYDELVKCEDVEICLTRPSEIGHCLTLSSFYFNDVNGDWVFDPGDSGKIDFIDPLGGIQKWCNFIIGAQGRIYTDYDVPDNYTSYISLAVTESVPVPPSLLLLGSGLLGLVGLRWKTKVPAGA
jgi:hypothetical protein